MSRLVKSTIKVPQDHRDVHQGARTLSPAPLAFLKIRSSRNSDASWSYWRILGLTIFSGGFVPGGLIDRMKAMIFQRSSPVLTEKPIGGIGACTLPYWRRSKPDFSNSAEPSLTSTRWVLPKNQMPCVTPGQNPPPPVPPWHSLQPGSLKSLTSSCSLASAA